MSWSENRVFGEPVPDLLKRSGVVAAPDSAAERREANPALGQ
jgi:hypothetical protein